MIMNLKFMKHAQGKREIRYNSKIAITMYFELIIVIT